MNMMSEAKTGFLWLTTNVPYGTSKQKLRVVAYTNVSDPFIVFYHDTSSIWKKPCAVLRLTQGFLVQEKNDLCFDVTPLGERIGDGPSSLKFTAANQTEKTEWMRIFSNSEQEKETTKTIVNVKERRKSSRCIPKLAAIEEADETWDQRQRKRSLILAWPQIETISTFITYNKVLHEERWHLSTLHIANTGPTGFTKYLKSKKLFGMVTQ